MNIYEAEKFLKEMYPGKSINMEFDHNCHREVNFIFTEGQAHGTNHVAFSRVKANVEGMAPFYIPIDPHRMCGSWNDLKKYINEKKEFHVHDNDLHILSDFQSLPNDHQDKWQYQVKMKEILDLSEITESDLLAKIYDYEQNRKPKSV